jgi:SAM-dependent methyltransferase
MTDQLPQDAAAQERARVESAFARRHDHPEIPSRYATAGDQAMLQDRERRLTEVLRPLYPEGLAKLDILDLGCGAGWDAIDLLNLGASLHRMAALDLLPDRVVAAHHRLPGLPVMRADGSRLPFPDASFDLATQFTVFTSILDLRIREGVAREMIRVVRPGGIILWYDMRIDNPRNLDIQGIGASGIRALFPACTVSLRSATLAPPIARRVARWSPTAATLLATLPFLRTHWIGVIRVPRR